MSFVVQIVTGILLSFYYSSAPMLAFESVYYISFNVFYGWTVRLLHVVGSFLCIYLLYLHFLRAFYYTFSFILASSFLYVYASGLLILVLSLAVSFIGYTLCWGQMSYWGITVILNVLTIMPGVLSWLLPELVYSSSLLILYRFFVLHFALSLLILALIVLHLFVLHSFMSSNSLFNLSSALYIPFYLFVLKDFYYYFVGYMSVLAFIFFYNFEFLSNCVNLVHSSSLATPAHILPESYYLLFYSLLRALPSKLLGVAIVLVFMFYLLFYNFNAL
jgi:ubiquinol-cytochrome c reductase cytochrome b subunit